MAPLKRPATSDGAGEARKRPAASRDSRSRARAGLLRGEPELLNKSGSSSRKVLIIYAGGTMGMQELGNGSLGPIPGALVNDLRHFQELQQKRMPQCHCVEFAELLDSADMCPADWMAIASIINEHYYEYDGFVVLHGTDTMAYTASALSFILEQLAKPVVLTGAQLPIFAPLSDARQNFLGAVVFAGLADISEVCVFFSGDLLRGNRTNKADATSLSAFASPMYPALSKIGTEIKIHPRRLREPPRGRFRMHTITETNILVIWVIPGFSDDVFGGMLKSRSIRGLVLLLYGCGNAPAKKKSFVECMGQLIKNGTVVVACSQCTKGTVHLEKYAVGKAFADVGVVSAKDMTTEAAVTKLSYLLSKDLSPAQCRQYMGEDLRGEVSNDVTTLKISEPTAGISTLM